MLASINVQPQGLSVEVKDYASGLPRVVKRNGIGLPELWVTNSWDTLNRLTSTVFPDGSAVSNIYDRLKLSATKDRMGFWPSFGYNGLEQLTWFKDARSNINFIEWCNCGSPVTISDPAGITKFFYNNQGLLTGVRFPDNSSVTNLYDQVGRLTASKDDSNRAINVATIFRGR